MNAVIGLCHFCEAHGPCPLFCTFTTKDEKHVTEASISSAQCTGCTSIGPETVYVTRNDGVIYCSRESLSNTELSAFLKQSAIRSITCEIISKELQDLSEIVFNKEQDVCSQRALRLKTGRNDFGPSRCLNQLTGDENIFKKLHGYFTGMLIAGGKTYTETLYTSEDLLKELDATSINASIFTPNACQVDTQESGIIVKTLLNLLPLPHSRRNEPKICLSNATVTPAASKCVLEEIENGKYACKWPGTLPTKCPTLMNKVENAMDETKFNNEVLNQHIKYLQLEWLGIAKAMKSAIDASGKNSDPVIKLKEVFGVTTQDDLLLNYWINEFCV
ncbi:hypothetical protein EVAR_82469_1 [Eumeta japonica]|uniref:Uncharacterized protein n=1 Tax=Eumeta variegata TaxID=151549 RepID=A0A4C1X6H0_EUMVA|nr:hypothetical protein EVAR_82469_1 [Eumeta japonica]